MNALEAQIAAEGGDDVIFDRIAGGQKVGDVMASYGRDRTFFYVWLKAGGEQRQAKYKAAQEIAADALVQEALDIVDEPVLIPADAAAARNRADFRKWMAGKYNRNAFGEEKAQVNVGIGLGDLFVQALQETGLHDSSLTAYVDGERLSSIDIGVLVPGATEDAEYTLVDEPADEDEVDWVT